MSVIETLKRFGITTGAAAAAGAKAATLYLINKVKVNRVVIPTPIGLRIEIPVEEIKEEGEEGEVCAKVKKFSGDNPDVLNGIEIVSCVSRIDREGIEVIGGEGVGKITAQGLRGINGYAISPTAYKMIVEAVKEVIERGILVKVIVPKGKEIAKETMNPLIGVKEGISILGTTGIEMPVSDEEFIAHVIAELCYLKSKTDKIALAFGNTSFEIAKSLGYEAVKIGDRVRDSITAAVKQGFREIILIGLPGKMTKVAAGILNTHNFYGDARIETITHAAVLAKLDMEKLEKIANSRTIAEALSYLSLEEKRKVMSIIANRVIERLKVLWNVNFKVLIYDEKKEKLAEA